MMDNRELLVTLYSLFRIVEAGEKGFAAASTNIHNSGIKALFKSYAQQRARFKDEIYTEIDRRDGAAKPRHSIRGILHRGSFSIFSGMTIGADNQERVILKEAARGEAAAERVYEKALQKELPPDLRDLILRQHQEIRKVHEQVLLMNGLAGKRMLVRLFDNHNEASEAIQEMRAAGFPEETIEQVSLNDAIDLYHGKGTTRLETIFAGVLYGSLLGIVLGVLSGLGMAQSINPQEAGNRAIFGLNLLGSTTAFFVVIVIGFIFVGALIGAVLSILLASASTEEDKYNYQETIENELVLVRAVVDQMQVADASRILDQAASGTRQSVMGGPA